MASTLPDLVGTISQIPECVRNSTVENIGLSGCTSIECLCLDDDLLTDLVYDLLRRCEKPDQDRGIEIAQQLCVRVLPSLNDDRGSEIIAVVAVMTVVATIAVVLRLLGRRISAAKYGVDDFLIVVALVLTYGLNINIGIAVHYGFGKHQLMLSLDHIKKFLLNDWTVQIMFASAISVTRLSLLVFYHRLFPVRRFTIVAVIMGVILIAWWISFLFAIIFSCVPVGSFWDKSIVGDCVNEHTLSWGVTGSELVVNIILLVLPIPWLWDLRLALTKKLALIGVFLLGCFVCISCVVRFPLLAGLVQTDASWTLVPAGVWIVVECNIGIASVCVPLMRPLISIEFSSLSSYFSFSRSRRTPSPFTEDLEDSSGLPSLGKEKSNSALPSLGKSKDSSGFPSMAKLCEKPYDGPRPEKIHVRGSSQHIAQQDSSRRKPLVGRGYRDNRTHRSRIESYSPEFWNPLQANPTKTTTPNVRHISSLTAYPPRTERLDPRLNTSLTTYPATRQPFHAQPSRTPMKPRRYTAPTTHPHLKPRPRSRRKTYRFSQQEMNERYRKWYQGRGSEVGRGLWGLEMVGSPTGSVGVESNNRPEGKAVETGMGDGREAVETGLGDERDEWEKEKRREKRRGLRGMEIPWEVGEEMGRGEGGSGIGVPRSRL